MSPKFKGDSEDWLDDENAKTKRSSGIKPKKMPKPRSVGIPWEESNAVVTEVFPNQCKVKIDSNSTELLCSYRRADVIGKSKTEARDRSPVAVGDRVLVQGTGSGTGIIQGICLRKNLISRPAPGRDGEKLQHVLAANLDYLVIVASTREPEFSPGLVDRFLIAAEFQKITPIICITKTDLWQNDTKPWQVYLDLNYLVFEVSAKEKSGLNPLLEKTLGLSVAFCGHSGVGKTSLLEVLSGKEVGKISPVNQFTGKGRHTTTGAVLLEGPQNSQWIDTPGIRAFGLEQLSPESLADFFPEFQKLSCTQSGCLHQEESFCQAKSLSRYSSYFRILESIRNGKFK